MRNDVPRRLSVHRNAARSDEKGVPETKQILSIVIKSRFHITMGESAHLTRFLQRPYRALDRPSTITITITITTEGGAP